MPHLTIASNPGRRRKSSSRRSRRNPAHRGLYAPAKKNSVYNAICTLVRSGSAQAESGVRAALMDYSSEKLYNTFSYFKKLSQEI